MNDNSHCPRCGQAFHCGVNDATPCWCVSVPLDQATLDELSRQYRGCLCKNCLAQLRDPPAAARPDGGDS